MSAASPAEPLRRWEKAVLAVLGLLLAGFVVMVEIRSCFLSARFTDLTDYTRAAWAARTGGDMYAVADEHGWHYCYPPPLALLLMPLADPPAGDSRDGYAPFWFSAGLWILVGLAAAWVAADAFARVVIPDAVPGSRRWVYARTMPLTFCLGGIGFSLSRGQVNMVLAAMMAWGFVATMRNRRFVSGLWLAAAAAMKVTPGLLILYPLLRRDGRALAGFAAGSVLMLVLFPAVFLGFDGAIDANRKMVELVLAPGVLGGGDRTRAEELTSALTTDNNSFQLVIHTWRNPGPQALRPSELDRATRLGHWAASGLMLAITLVVAWRRREAGPADQLVLFGSLVLVMLLMSPVSHIHHFAMAQAAVSGLWLKGVASRPGSFRPGWRTILVLSAWAIGIAVLLIPGDTFIDLREHGLGTAVTLLMWGVGLAAVCRTPTAAALPAPQPVPLPRAA